MMVVKIKLLQIKVLFPPCTKSHAECATDIHCSEQDATENQSQSDCSARIQDWAAHIQDQPKSGKPWLLWGLQAPAYAKGVPFVPIQEHCARPRGSISGNFMPNSSWHQHLFAGFHLVLKSGTSWHYWVRSLVVLWRPLQNRQDTGYDSIATVGEIRVYWRANFQSGSRVLKKVFWTFSYLYLWHTMWFHAKKLLKTQNR